MLITLVHYNIILDPHNNDHIFIILEFKRYKIYVKILLLCLLFVLCVILIKWCIITFI